MAQVLRVLHLDGHDGPFAFVRLAPDQDIEGGEVARESDMAPGRRMLEQHVRDLTLEPGQEEVQHACR